MAESFFSAVNYPLSLLIQNIEAGEIALSGIQRPFVWPNAKVRDLFDSMYRGFPVGYLLFAPYDSWRAGPRERAPRLLIVDGQQRLTSLYSVIKGTPVTRDDFREEHLRIAFRPSDARFEVADAAIRRDPEFIPDISPLFSGNVSQYRFVREFLETLRAQRPVGDEEEGRISAAIYRLYELQSYSFTVLQLSRSLDEEQVAEVFVRINSRGVPLSQADFVLTLIAVSWEDGRRALEEFCRQTRAETEKGGASPFNTLLRPTPDQLLRVVSALAFRRVRLQAIYPLLQGRDPATRQPSEEKRAEQFKLFEEAQGYTLNPENWHRFLATVRAAGYVSPEMIPSGTALLHCFALFLIGKRDFVLDEATLARVISRWIFAALLTGRYSGSSDGVVESDLAALGAAEGAEGFVATLEGLMNGSLTDSFWKNELPAQLATTSPRSNSVLGYYAALNVLGARGLFSQARVSDHFEGKAALVRRQLFPRRMLARQRHADHATQAANYALVDPSIPTSGSPSDYYPTMAAGTSPQSVAQMVHWHALPNGWQEMDYLAFLPARRQAMAGIIREAFERLGDIAQARVPPVQAIASL